jgi:hypothetical protein
MLVLHSNASAMPILDYPRPLLLLLFIKPDHTSKCGITCFIIKKFNKSFTFWIFSRIVLRLVVYPANNYQKLDEFL